MSCDSVETKRDRFFLQGNNALEIRDYDQAIKYYDLALELDSDFELAYNNRGVAKMQDGNPHEAVQDYNQAILINRNYWECIHNRAQAYDQVGKYNKSLIDFKTLIEQFPDSTYGYFGEGLVLTRLGEYENARRSFEMVLKLIPNDHDAIINLATLEYYQGNLDEALVKINGALSISENANAYNTLNQIYLAREDYNSALEAINKALEIIPKEPFFLNNRGFTFLMMNSLDEGITDINRSIVIDPDNIWAFRNKGIYFMKLADFEQAILYLGEAASSKEFIEDIFYYLGESYRLSGQMNKACETWATGALQSEKKSEIQVNRYCN